MHTLHDTRHTKSSTVKPIAIGTIIYHWRALSAILNQAVKDEVISSNPCKMLTPPKTEDKEKVYLTLSELQLFAKTDCPNAEIKRAFLFSCLTGLRWSDVYKLKWSEIQEVRAGQYRIAYNHKKTKGLNYLPLPEQALQYISERDSPHTNVSNLPASNSCFSKHLTA